MPAKKIAFDEEARRAYWTEQMEAGYRFMTDIREYPVRECGEAMAPLPEAAEQAGVEVVFSTTKVAGDHDRLFYLREGLIADFVAAAREMNQQGWALKVEDGYRTRTIQKYLARQENIFDIILKRVLWERRGRTPSAEEVFRRLSALIATSPKVGTHMSGSALDITVLVRDDGSEVDRGGKYIELSELTPMQSPFITPRARRNRDDITALMGRHGFAAYPYEFWHYSKGDAFDEYLAGSGKPARYGAVDVDEPTGRTTPIENPREPLNSLEEIQREIERALERIAGTA